MDALLKYNKLQQKSVQSKPKPSTIASNERDEDDDQNGNQKQSKLSKLQLVIHSFFSIPFLSFR